MEILTLLESINVSVTDILDYGLEAGKVIVSKMSEPSAVKGGLPSADLESVKRLMAAIQLLADPVSKLVTIEKTEPGTLPKSVSKALVELGDCLNTVRGVLNSDPREASAALKERGFSTMKLADALDQLREELYHGLRLMTLAVKMAQYTTNLKVNTLTKVIADSRAANLWRENFGDSGTEADFESVVEALDRLFSTFGEKAFSGECSSTKFFSFLRHEGSWSFCDKCRATLKERLVDTSSCTKSKDQVTVLSFAKFCGDNALFALRDVIQSAHPAKREEFQLVDPLLHLSVAGREEAKDVSDGKCRIVFVGNSDMLAEVHYSTCKITGAEIGYKIDSVADFEEFKKWSVANSTLLADKSSKIMVVSSCQISCDSESEMTLAEEVHRYLMQEARTHVGFAVVCCPFLSHGPDQMHRLKWTLSKTLLKYVSMSTDGKVLSDFINTAFSRVLATESMPPGSSKTWSAGDTAEGAAGASKLAVAGKGSFATAQVKTGRFAQMKADKEKAKKAKV